jgi:hypothetical protein
MARSNFESTIKSNIFEDFASALLLFKQNFGPFFIVLIIGAAFYFGFDYYFCTYLYRQILNYTFIPPNILYSLVRIPKDLVIYGFIGVSVGLAYDIMSSGDQFTETKNSVFYIKKYWLKYSILSFLLNGLGYIVYFFNGFHIGLEFEILMRIFSYFWFIIISEAYAGLINRPTIIRALDDNFFLLKTSFKKIIAVFSLYYVIFLLPRSILGIIQRYFLPAGSNIQELLGLVRKVLTGIYIIGGFPIFSFISISIYNSNILMKKNTIGKSSGFN